MKTALKIILAVCLSLFLIEDSALAAKGKRRGRAKKSASAKTGKGKKAKAPKPKEEAAPAPAPKEATDDTRSLRRGERIEFDARLIQGQTAKAGAVYLFERASTNLRSMVKDRTSFRDKIVRMVFKDEEKTP